MLTIEKWLYDKALVLIVTHLSCFHAKSACSTSLMLQEMILEDTMIM